MENIKVSIITVCCNSGRTIEDTFKSILEQSYQNIEYIVIDGGSTDNTSELIEDYTTQFIKRSISFKFISEKDRQLVHYENGSCPNAEKRCKQVVTLQVHPSVKQRDIDRAVKFLNEA